MPFGYHDLPSIWKNHVAQGLLDDGVPWDFTTALIPKTSATARARVIAKADGVFSALGLAHAVMLTAAENGWNLKIENQFESAGPVRSGQVVSVWSGDRQAIVTLERVYLNLASFVSGISTQTASLVQIVNSVGLGDLTPRITCTRKLLPYFQNLSILGVVAGGGYPHRVGLSGGILIKENHIKLAGGVEKILNFAKKSAPHPLRLEIEVQNLNEVEQALTSGAEILLLDNFKPEEVRRALEVILSYREKTKSRISVEVSGGIQASNIRDYVVPGVDVISVGSLTHSVKGLDLSLLVD